MDNETSIGKIIEDSRRAGPLPTCQECGKQHEPNGTKIGSYAGASIIIDCRIDPNMFPNGLFV